MKDKFVALNNGAGVCDVINPVRCPGLPILRTYGAEFQIIKTAAQRMFRLRSATGHQ
jgi:hypothetical protein